MLHTEQMQKIRILSLDEDRDKVVAALHMMGAIDLRKSKLPLNDDHPAQNATALSDSLIKVSGAISLLSKQEVKPEKQIPVEKLVEEVRKFTMLDRIYRLGSDRKGMADDQKAVEYAEHIAQSFSEIGMDFSRLKSNYLAYRAFETDKKGAKAFAKRAKRVTYSIEVHSARTGRKTFLLLVAYDKAKSIDELFKGVKINELDLTAKYLAGTPKEILAETRKRKLANEKGLATIEKELEEISRRCYSRLANLEEMLSIEMQRSDVSSNFKRTEKTFVVEGWIQKRELAKLTQGLTNTTKNKILIEELPADELAPTHTRRPGFLKPFDYLVSFYSVQRSDEIDPTWIFIISFPIFYGLMVSDVGYGLASLFLATWITKRTDPEGLMYNAAKLWQLNSFAAIAFGLLSNQWFGFQLNSYVGLTQGAFNWLTNTPELIAITVIFGVVQVILGLALGMYNSYHQGHKKLAIARFTSILVVLFGTIAVAGAFFGAFSGAIIPISAGISILSLLLTAVFSGSEATEITNLITHPLSYARLMGFGLGSVIIAFLINMAFTPHLGFGIVGILLFVVYLVIFIALHFLNMILSIFEGLVQGVRLNFVEFFSKFYIGNGIPFRPFSYKRVYTKE